MNELPEGWKLVKLGEVCKMQNGFAFKSTEYTTEGMPIIRISDINGGIVSTEKSVRIKDRNEFKDYLVEKGDILVAMSGATTGKFGLFDTNEKAYQNQRVGKFKILNPRVLDRQFLYYQINSLKRVIEKDAYGGAQPNISSGKIEQMEFFLPPLPVQQAIVTKIEEIFSELDHGVEQLKVARAQLKVYRQAVLKWAFEGRLTNEGVVDGEMPEGWKWVKINEVAQTFGGYAFKSGEFKSEGKYQVLRMGNVRPGILRYDESPVFINDIEESILFRSLLQPDDIIITQTGTRKKRDYGFTAMIQKSNLLLNQRIAAVRFSEAYLPKLFLYFSWTDVFKDQFFANETGNVGQGNVGMKAVTETLIPLIPLTEQHQIVSEIERRLSVCDKLEETIVGSLKAAEVLRAGVLKRAFEGKLVG